ncbi:dTDP-4-dehydrorhamnose 3,5-epimerase [Jeotgalibaca ciconiae]|uniref:dTDP-4-dehydrorhamnose 3,5-epimerase n=1 Tax=Jeotgalibaca ciconiae TaxID=2496265 RepID=A0A3Q9BN30_9LACT|nr:dTDP-4-dehydrorhamnose 3,5-epimerase [Jeotgalibaca ciconiae]AZP04923.1 dTDP-4-dehydrorhamnose 3,5-epimerase [Jeotgalibaca ciconiae]
MKVIETNLQDVKIIETAVFGDHRGFFTESYSKETFNKTGIMIDFIQDNHSLSVEPGVLRGMHFQTPDKAQTKLVRATTGAIYDVLVDIRIGSPTYGKWEGYILSEYNHRQLLVPKGFAHGFVTLTPNCNVQYKVDEYYSKEHDGGIAFDDPAIGIEWPMPMDKLVLSEKDTQHPTLAGLNNPFIYGEI